MTEVHVEKSSSLEELEAQCDLPYLLGCTTDAVRQSHKFTTHSGCFFPGSV